MFGRNINKLTKVRGLNFQRNYSSVKLPELGVEQVKPRIRDFKNPLFHTFLLASSTYIILHTLWINLEYKEEEQKLKEKSKLLEDKIQYLIDEKGSEIKARKSWFNYFRFWK